MGKGHANSNHEKTGVAIMISDKIDLNQIVTRRGTFKMIKWSIHTPPNDKVYEEIPNRIK